MIELQGLSLENVVCFKEQAVDFNKNRITFVRGLNMDSDPANPSGNGAGKSLLFSCPANVFYFTPPLAIKKKAKKELLGKGSSITVRIKGRDGKSYQIKQTASKYTIECDGLDMGIRTTPLAEKFIRQKLFPMSELVYYTTSYVSTQKPFLMQSSSDVDRLEHLSKIFDLDSYDGIQRFFLNKLGEVRDGELQLQMLERDYLEARKRLKNAKSRVAEGIDVDGLKTKKKGLDETIEKLVKEEYSTKSYLRDLTTLISVEEELDALRESYKVKKKPEEYRRYLKSQRRATREWDAYEERLSDYARTVKETQAKLDALELPDLSAKKLTKRLAAAETALEELQDQLRELKNKRREHERLRDKRDELASDLKELGFGPKNKPDLKANYDEDIAKCRTTLGLKKLLDHDHDDEGTCPTCLSPVDVDNIRTLVNDAKKKLPKLENAKRAQSMWTKYEEANTAFKNSEFDEDSEDKLRKRISAAGPAIETIKKQLKVWEKHDLYSRMLADVKKPKEPEEKPTADMTMDELDTAIELCEDIIKHLASRDKLIENNDRLSGLRTVNLVRGQITETEERLLRLGKSIKRSKAELSEIVQSLDNASSADREIEVYQKEVKRVSAKIEEARPLVEDKKLLSALSKAYSSKGIKTVVANEICALLEQNLNAYSNLIFNEPFVFGVIAGDKGLSIMVDRSNGHPPSDVRNLSGAESNAFRLLFVFSLLPLLPDDKRVNMLTLDEPCAHMDSISRTKFLQVFLPALSEIVPNIYVITPHESDYCEGSNLWTVRKESGKSRVLFDGIDNAVSIDVTKLVKRARKSAKARRKK